MDWLLLQLSDSAFPAGGFAHSGGLEAAWQQGEISGAEQLNEFIRDSLWQAGRAALPLMSAAHDGVETLRDLDELNDAFLTNHVPNQASRTQGRAFISSCEKCFPLPEMLVLRQQARDEKSNYHYAPLFGAALKCLGVEREKAQEVFLFNCLRGVVSAAVRLNIVGPHQAQQIQFLNFETCNTVLDVSRADGAANRPFPSQSRPALLTAFPILKF
jgi:urease accessory protein